MQRISTAPRNRWREAVEKLGFGFHTTNVPYWDESAYYSLPMEEVLQIEDATTELWELCLSAVQHVIDQKLYPIFHIAADCIPLIEHSWNEDHPSIYGRFDLCVRDGQVKMLEFNADTPTSLYEAGIVQWFWLQDIDAGCDQFNSIHDKLVAYWDFLRGYLYPGPLHFACLKGTHEDLTNVEYLRDCAMQAGIGTRFVFIEDIGWDAGRGAFVDDEGEEIRNLFKLYPWEWLMGDEFAPQLLAWRGFVIEPAWKMILSNKAILPVLWELFPGHPNLLPAYFDVRQLTNYVRKPILSREGANIDIVVDGQVAVSTDGEYGEEGFIYQQLFELPDHGGVYPLVGSWVIGQQSAGIGIREASGLVTDNMSRFVPHLISDESL